MYIIVAGGGVVGEQIVKILVANKHDVVVIDIDKNVCENIYAETGALTINGSATSIKILKEAGAEKADFLLCLMHNDADNIAASLLGKSLNVKKVLGVVRKSIYYEAYKKAGVDIIIKLSDLLLNRVITQIEEPPIKALTSIGTGGLTVYSLEIPEKSHVIDKKIKELHEDKRFPNDFLMIGIYKSDKDHFLIPKGGSVIGKGDRIFFVVNNADLDSVEKFFFSKK